MKTRRVAIGLLMFGLCCAPAQAKAQTAQQGKAALVACIGCHSLDGSARPGGPTLKGVFGRKAAADPGFKRYSRALRDSGIVWTAQELDAYLKAPAARVKGTAKVSAVADETRRKAIIAYLRTLK
jgi:cytochrome c